MQVLTFRIWYFFHELYSFTRASKHRREVHMANIPPLNSLHILAACKFRIVFTTKYLAYQAILAASVENFAVAVDHKV